MDWIMFYAHGKVVIDVVLHDEQAAEYPRHNYCITPHYGKVAQSIIIERRGPELPERA